MKKDAIYWKGVAARRLMRMREIAAIIENVDRRCEAVDGPVTQTNHEITNRELKRIYDLANELTIKPAKVYRS